jgi:polyhydroxybutyrate depolymerase
LNDPLALPGPVTQGPVSQSPVSQVGRESVRAALGLALTLGFAACLNGAAAQLPTPTQTSIDTQVGGATRTALLVIPRAAPQSLVVWLHGDGGSGAQLQSAIHYEQYLTAPAVVVYPTSRTVGWDLETPTARNLDVEYIEKLVAQLLLRYQINTHAVFAAGISNGGYFVHALACRVPGLLRAVAAHAGGAPYETAANPLGRYPNGYYKCAPNQLPVSALIEHGAADHVVTPENGELAAKYWGYIGGCQPAPVQDPTGACVDFAKCAPGIAVRRCIFPGLGHGFAPNFGNETNRFFAAQLAN